MRKLILTLTALASLTMANLHAETQIVTESRAADATHIYFVNEISETDYELNPKAFAQGWRDGWNWLFKDLIAYDKRGDDPAGLNAPLPKRPSRAAIEARERKLYGDIDNPPGDVKSLGFDAVCDFVWNR